MKEIIILAFLRSCLIVIQVFFQSNTSLHPFLIFIIVEYPFDEFQSVRGDIKINLLKALVRMLTTVIPWRVP